MRENASAKAARLLTSGRVRVVTASLREAVVIVAGRAGRYRVDVKNGVARCRCAAATFGGNCSHKVAALLVTLAALPRPLRPDPSPGPGGTPTTGIAPERAPSGAGVAS